MTSVGYWMALCALKVKSVYQYRLTSKTSIKNLLCLSFVYTVGPRYMRGIGTPKIDSHMMNSYLKRPRMTDN